MPSAIQFAYDSWKHSVRAKALPSTFIMGVLNNGMSIMGIGIDYQQMIKGAVLLAAVFVDVYQKSKV